MAVQLVTSQLHLPHFRVRLRLVHPAAVCRCAPELPSAGRVAASRWQPELPPAGMAVLFPSAWALATAVTVSSCPLLLAPARTRPALVAESHLLLAVAGMRAAMLPSAAVRALRHDRPVVR